MRVYWPRSTRTQRRFRPVGPGGTRRYTGAVRKFLPTVQEAAVSAAMRVVPRVLFKNVTESPRLSKQCFEGRGLFSFLQSKTEGGNVAMMYVTKYSVGYYNPPKFE